MGDTNTIFIPIMCCGKQMDEIFIDEKRVMAICGICGKTWKPVMPKINIHKFTLIYKVKVEKDDNLDEKTEELRQKVGEMRQAIQEEIASEIEKLWKEVLYKDAISGNTSTTTDESESEIVPIWKDTPYNINSLLNKDNEK